MTTALHWSARFVGMPWEDCDCWQLAADILFAEKGVRLPTYARGSLCREERQEIARILEARHAWPWLPVPRGAEQPFDLVVLRIGTLAAHVGVVIDKGRMIHTIEGSESAIDCYTSERWASRFEGIYRHADLAT